LSSSSSYNLQNSELVEVHEAGAEVPVEAKSKDVQKCQDCQWCQKIVCPVQHVEGAVAKESDVNIVTQSYQPQAVAKECGKKYFSFYDGVVDKELDKVEDDQDGDESIEMNIKAEAPLNVLISEIGFQQELVRHKPETCGNHQTNPNKIHEYHINQELDEAPQVNIKHKWEACSWYDEESCQ